MMPILARNPPSSHVPALLLLLLLNNSTVDQTFASFEVKLQRSWRPRSWRRPNGALLLLLCTVLVLFTANFTVADHAGFESVLDRSEPEVESESGNDSEFARPHDCMLKKTTTPGLTTRMNNQQLAVSNLKDWPLQGIQCRHRKGRRFIFPVRRRVLVASLITGACTNKDISIFQKTDGSSGIPRYAVQIMNNCMSECAPSNIHVFCGWFASAMLVNPNSFKRIAFDDCVVNGGRPLRHGETLRFTYANSFMYPIRFKSASFCK